MLRGVLTAYLALVTAAGPCLCCCVAGQLLAAARPTPLAESTVEQSAPPCYCRSDDKPAPARPAPGGPLPQFIGGLGWRKPVPGGIADGHPSEIVYRGRPGGRTGRGRGAVRGRAGGQRGERR